MDSWYVNQPAKGRRSVGRRDLAGHVCGVLCQITISGSYLGRMLVLRARATLDRVVRTRVEEPEYPYAWYGCNAEMAPSSLPCFLPCTQELA